MTDTLAGQKVKDTYGRLMQIANANDGADGTLRSVMDGKGDATALSLSTTDGDLLVKPSGTTTARGVRARFGEVANVRDFGALGDGVTDDTAAIQAAVDGLPAIGGTIYFPPGTYLFTTTVFLPSNTTVKGDGPATIMKAIAGANWVLNTVGTSTYTTGSIRVLFLNENWDSDPIVDENYLFADFAVDLDTAASVQRKAFCSMISARNTEFRGITTRGGGAVISHLHTENSNVHDCMFLDFHSSATDHYSGFKNAIVNNNYLRQTAVSSNNPAIQFTGTNNDNTDNTSDGVICAGNKVLCTGTYLNNVGGISITAAGVGGTVNNVLIAHNDIDMDGLAAGGIVCYGGGDNWRIIGNTVRNVADYNCIIAFSNGLGTPTRVQILGNRVIDCTRTSGGATLVSVTADGSTLIDNDLLDCTATTGAAITDAAGVGYLRSGNTSGSTLTNVYTTSGTVTVDGQFFGSWTPVVTFGGVSTGITYSTQTGYYVRQGNLVYLECTLVLTSKGAATGTAQITGIPFTDPVGSTPPGRLQLVSLANMNSITEDPRIRVSDDRIVLAENGRGGANLTDANFANNTNLSFCGWYRTG